MQKVLNLLLILLLVSCSTKNNEPLQKKVVITGRILNADPMIFQIKSSVSRVGIGQESISPFINDDGSFKISFESYIPTDVWILYKMNFLVLTHPGDSIHLEFDGSKEERTDILKTIKFSGDASLLNQEAAAFQHLYFSSSTYSDWERKQQAFKDYNENQYKIFRDTIQNEGNVLFNKFVKEVKPSEEVKNWAKTFIDLEYYRALFDFPIMHRMTNNLKNNEQIVSISYFDFLGDQFSINKYSQISGYSLTSFVDSYAIYVHEKIRNENQLFFNSADSAKKHPEILDSLRFFGTIKHTKDPLLRQMALTEMLYESLDGSDIRMFEKYKNQIQSYIQEPYLREPLFNLYSETLHRLDNPKLASDAILRKLKGTSLKSDIDSIISLNTGKVIYMDCWATWCGPCIAEMPNSKKLIEEYKTKDVAFIFICLDSEEKNWKSIISKNSLAGQHFLLNKNQSTDFREAFEINGIPHYILFDKEGNIFENGTTPPGFVKDKIDILLTNN